MKSRSSAISLIICCVVMFVTGVFYYPKWKQPATEATLSWDVSGYYFYLPAIFIYKDPKRLHFADSILKKYQPTPDLQQAWIHRSGNYVMKYPLGQAVLFSPWFAAGHVSALLCKVPADGFSYPYQLAIGLGMMLYAFLGLFVLRKTLLFYFSDQVTAVTLLLIVLGTNYLNYAAIDGAMAHNTLFTLYSFLLYFTSCFYRKPDRRFAIGIGICIGLLVLVRPTEIICVLIPLLWQMRAGLAFLKRNTSFIVLAGSCALLISGLQLVYWKWITGDWFVYSYHDEGFYWLHPEFVNGLFSYKAGWLVYTPLMILVVPGFWFLFHKDRSMAFCLLLFFLLFMYSCFSWWNWWYGGALGQRAMIQSYPFLAFALAALFERVRLRSVAGCLLVCFAAICVWYNLWLTHQAHRGGLFKAAEMNRQYFWKVFGRLDVPPETSLLLDNPDSFTGDTSKPVFTSELYRGEQVIQKEQATQAYAVRNNPAAAWVRGLFELTTPVKEWTTWNMPQAILKFYKTDSLIGSSFVRISRVMGNGDTRIVHLDARNIKQADRITLSVWNAGSGQTVVVRKIAVRFY